MIQNPIKVLLIENDMSDVRHVRQLLADTRATETHVPAFEMLHTDRLATALAYLQNIPFDIILLGIFPQDEAGKETFTAVRQNAPTLPLLILGTEETAHTSGGVIRRGAQDFLLKAGLTAERLVCAIHFAIIRQQQTATAVAAAQQAAAAENMYHALVENNADGIVLVRKDGIVLFVNAAAAQILRQDEAQLIGNPFTLPLPKRDTAEFNLTHPNDQSTSIEMRLVETEWQGERVYQASLRDITAHQRAKAAIRDKAAELEIRNIALDEFAHTMAHQVQGLLSQMMGYASFIEMQYGRKLDADFNTAVKRIVQSGHKMNNVISELLLLAGIRSGDVEVEPLNMQRVVAEAIKRMRYQIEQSGAQIILPPDWPIALGHGSWIEEAWVNYISNGIKYGGAPPRLELGSTLMENDMIQYWVQDNGPGISEVDQKLLFKPHTRLGPKQVRGEGLGLSIVRRIVAKCGGEVGVESFEGHGSKFWFSLPRATDIDSHVRL